MHQALGWLSVGAIMGAVLFAAYAPQGLALLVFNVLNRRRKQ